MKVPAQAQSLKRCLPGDVTTRTLRPPVGVWAGISPWNGSLTALWWIVGAVLATGCTCGLKPTTEALLRLICPCETLHGIGLPKGAVSRRDALARPMGVGRIAVTGSTETGRRIIDAAKTDIQHSPPGLGGKSPNNAFADLGRAVPRVFGTLGQVCFGDRGFGPAADRRRLSRADGRISQDGSPWAKVWSPPRSLAGRSRTNSATGS